MSSPLSIRRSHEGPCRGVRTARTLVVAITLGVIASWTWTLAGEDFVGGPSFRSPQARIHRVRMFQGKLKPRGVQPSQILQRPPVKPDVSSAQDALPGWTQEASHGGKLKMNQRVSSQTGSELAEEPTMAMPMMPGAKSFEDVEIGDTFIGTVTSQLFRREEYDGVMMDIGVGMDVTLPLDECHDGVPMPDAMYDVGDVIEVRVLFKEGASQDSVGSIWLTGRSGTLERPMALPDDNNDKVIDAFREEEGWLVGKVYSMVFNMVFLHVAHPTEAGKVLFGALHVNQMQPASLLGSVSYETPVEVRVMEVTEDNRVYFTMERAAEYATKNEAFLREKELRMKWHDDGGPSTNDVPSIDDDGGMDDGEWKAIDL